MVMVKLIKVCHMQIPSMMAWSAIVNDCLGWRIENVIYCSLAGKLV